MKMNAVSWLVLGVIVAVVGAIITSSLIRRKKGKSSCGGNCAGCALSDKCHPEK